MFRNALKFYIDVTYCFCNFHININHFTWGERGDGRTLKEGPFHQCKTMTLLSLLYNSRMKEGSKVHLYLGVVGCG